ncbi:GntP family permease [Robertkochia flava]|uniref:GntP family permease n=1 Tax=Robertkochia flava TaxID=3447986 RepID=UPI001CC9A083|nr:gluconate:H+ symporter [Robertkochia marina]
MNEHLILTAVVTGIALLLFLILKLRIHAFLSLLISSIVVGLIAGMGPDRIIGTVQSGMGGTLGYVATVVGLGAIFGAILEHSGGARVIASHLLERFGIRKAPLALSITGFIIAIPVFFEVGFILMVPMLYALQKRTGRSLLFYAIPLLSGLAVTHAFIPPTPGPIAVADIIGADLGSVIMIGILAGIPTTLVSGLFFGKFIGNRIYAPVPEAVQDQSSESTLSSGFSLVLWLIAVPIVLILCNTLLNSEVSGMENTGVASLFALIGHPFSALIIANLLAWYFLGIRKGVSRKDLQKISNKSLAPAGIIILITGAGGVFKQVLIDTGAGEILANSLSDLGVPILLFAFIMAALVRIVQGSATVAMITAAGLVAPVIDTAFSSLEMACMVIAVASGASIFSHLNDSGFWLVSQYLGLDEKQTFRSWTMMTTLLALTGLASVGFISLWV